mmetsp:Transcript_26300/g.75468  ORF Transcript_26300/g.75468 Transcript_26300/m.75468 type:complete len:297 (-) Transcript_26300:682-1572(-)
MAHCLPRQPHSRHRGDCLLPLGPLRHARGLCRGAADGAGEHWLLLPPHSAHAGPRRGPSGGAAAAGAAAPGAAGRHPLAQAAHRHRPPARGRGPGLGHGPPEGFGGGRDHLRPGPPRADVESGHVWLLGGRRAARGHHPARGPHKLHQHAAVPAARQDRRGLLRRASVDARRRHCNEPCCSARVPLWLHRLHWSSSFEADGLQGWLQSGHGLRRPLGLLQWRGSCDPEHHPRRGPELLCHLRGPCRLRGCAEGAAEPALGGLHGGAGPWGLQLGPHAGDNLCHLRLAGRSASARLQ